MCKHGENHVSTIVSFTPLYWNPTLCSFTPPLLLFSILKKTTTTKHRKQNTFVPFIWVHLVYVNQNWRIKPPPLLWADTTTVKQKHNKSSEQRGSDINHFKLRITELIHLFIYFGSIIFGPWPNTAGLFSHRAQSALIYRVQLQQSLQCEWEQNKQLLLIINNHVWNAHCHHCRTQWASVDNRLNECCLRLPLSIFHPSGSRCLRFYEVRMQSL